MVRSVLVVENAEAPSLRRQRASRHETHVHDTFKRRHCIARPADFFEWSGPKAARQPWYISAADGGLLGFAGLYDTWDDPETGDELRSCTIVVGPANRFMSSIHERMPVILGPAAWPAWFEAPNDSLLRPAPEDLLQRWPVTSVMNASRYDAADAIEAIGEPVPPI